jgi:hypothetical protein
MWNKIYSNRKCNEIFKEKDHKEHLERIILVTSIFPVKKPYTQEFPLIHSCRSDKLPLNKVFKINYENFILKGKLDSVKNSHTNFHPSKIKFTKVPHLKKGEEMKKKAKHLDSENKRFSQRLHLTKTSYSVNDFRKDYVKNNYYSKLIISGSESKSPYLKFETSSHLLKRLDNYLLNLKPVKNNSNISYVNENFPKKMMKTSASYCDLKVTNDSTTKLSYSNEMIKNESLPIRTSNSLIRLN